MSNDYKEEDDFEEEIKIKKVLYYLYYITIFQIKEKINEIKDESKGKLIQKEA